MAVLRVAILGVSLTLLCSCAASPDRRREGAAASPPAEKTGPAPVSTAWTPVPAPGAPADEALVGISATGAEDAWAVGHEKAAEGDVGETVLLHWDGGRWREAPGAADDRLATAIAAVAPKDVWVVGADGPGPAFASHWDGTRWTVRRPFGTREHALPTDVSATGGKAWFAGSGPIRAPKRRCLTGLVIPEKRRAPPPGALRFFSVMGSYAACPCVRRAVLDRPLLETPSRRARTRKGSRSTLATVARTVRSAAMMRLAIGPSLHCPLGEVYTR
ncbi:hypothetical protein GCM10023191_004130 [Actinoallomurus oryzae]|uniref:Uncharacterized protein n=1 Tax=Actinoallomurus oryzae TaxID=502180 RepID=A0ABP8P8E4_9ACTN